MPEEQTIVAPEEPEEDAVEALLRDILDEPDLAPDTEEIAEEAEAEADKDDAKDDKNLRKVAGALAAHLSEEKSMKAYNDAIASMDELERDLAVAIMAPGDEPDVVAKKAGLIKARAAKLREVETEKVAEAEKTAEDQLSKAWGVPMSSPPAPVTDEEKAEMEKIASGDVDAAFRAIVGEGPPV